MTTTGVTIKRPATSKQVGLKYGFRSGLEEDTAAELRSLGIEFSFEEVKIAYVKPERPAKYTPDFLITHRPDGTERAFPLFIETKGRFLTADRQKHLLIKRQHPHLDIRFLFENPDSRISKGSKTTYALWCAKHGFQYAQARRTKSKGSPNNPIIIPQHWLEE